MCYLKKHARDRRLEAQSFREHVCPMCVRVCMHVCVGSLVPRTLGLVVAVFMAKITKLQVCSLAAWLPLITLICAARVEGLPFSAGDSDGLHSPEMVKVPSSHHISPPNPRAQFVAATHISMLCVSGTRCGRSRRSRLGRANPRSPSHVSVRCDL